MRILTACSISIANKGKAAIFEANAIAAIVRLLKTGNDDVLLNAIQVCVHGN